MTCHHVRLSGGGSVILCGTRRSRCACGRAADLLCDWKLPGKRTCDAPICASCTTCPAPGKDLCPNHAIAWKEWKAVRRRDATLNGYSKARA